jgi:hypothetical protein
MHGAPALASARLRTLAMSAGIKAATDTRPSPAVKEPLLCNARASATVGAVNRIPIA